MNPTPSIKRLLQVTALGLLPGLFGCAYAGSVYPTGVQSALARDTMRTLQTAHLDITYPTQHRAGAEALAARMETCITQLSSLAQGGMPTERLNIVYTSAEFNNAFVTFPSLGQPLRMVLPVHEALEFFNLVNIGVADVPQVSCHESVHYLTSLQANGFWGAIDSVFGNVYLPVSSLPLWVHEGMATFYEGQLGGEFGRPKSLLWRGQFEAGVVSREGVLHAGDLDPGNRELGFYGAHYLVGMHFVEYLAHRYGDAKLWQLIQTQSESFFSPFGITLRFKQVFGGDLDDLFGEFTNHLASTFNVRERPPTQKQIAPALGYQARLATCRADGALITVTDDADAMAKITVRNRDGTLRFNRLMTDILPLRDQISFGGNSISGLDCSSDGQHVFFVAADTGNDGNFVNKLWQLDARTGAVQHIWPDIPGIGGGVRPDGGAYAYVGLRGERAYLGEIDLFTGEHTEMPSLEGATSLGAPAYSPDGAQLVFAARSPLGFNLFLRDAAGAISQLTDDAGDSYAPRWLSPTEIVFVREHAGRLQAHRVELTSGEIHAVSDAPYAVLDAAPLDAQHIAILSAEGWGWSLDEVALPTEAVAETEDVPEPPLLPATPDAAVEEPVMALAEAPAAAASALCTPQGRDRHVPIASRPDTAAPVTGDTRYHGYAELLRPTLLLPYYMLQGYSLNDALRGINPSYGHSTVALAVEGQDLLGYHAYAINAAYAFDVHIPALQFTYLNYQLAPWRFAARATQNPSLYRVNVEQSGVLSLRRTFWTSSASVSAVGYKRRGRSGYPGQDLEVWGPSLTLTYGAADSTPYGGTLRALQLSSYTAVYPDVAGAGHGRSLIDQRLEIDITVPLPLSRRHSLSLSASGRQIFRAPQRLLVGGGSGSLGILSDTLSFSEPVRGYAYANVIGWATNRIAIAQVSYNYPLIIDYGWHSVLWLIPQLFIQQVNMELFATAAWSDSRVELHRAAGLEVTAPLTVGGVPFAPGVEVSYRFDQFPGWEAAITLPLPI